MVFGASHPFLPVSGVPGIPAGVGVAPWQGRTAAAGREAPPRRRRSVVGWSLRASDKKAGSVRGTCHYPVRVNAGARGASRRTACAAYAARVPRWLTVCIRGA
ncbi:hypothetical protein GCM10009864_52330 [Streptomyces lunalinharesii]|uniref:Uncharacterized protein n=1 Tax=Streptomyces lunalinharesii TaxID=333384 RepID=A0ABN3SHL2_9ACTN